MATGYALGALPGTITYNSGTNQLTGQAGRSPYTRPERRSPSMESRCRLRGTPANNDTFVVARNAAGVCGNRNALALEKLQTQATVAGGTANQDAYARLVSDVRDARYQVTGAAQSALLKQSPGCPRLAVGRQPRRRSSQPAPLSAGLSGLCKMLDIGSKLFDVILSIRSDRSFIMRISTKPRSIARETLGSRATSKASSNCKTSCRQDGES